MNYSCRIRAYMRQPGNRQSDLVAIHFPVPHTANSHYSEDSKITAKHLPNTNLQGLADHKRTELTKKALTHSAQLHTGLGQLFTLRHRADGFSDLPSKSKFGCPFLELLLVNIDAGRRRGGQRNAPKASFFW